MALKRTPARPRNLRSRSRAPNQIEQDFLDAIERLRAGRPQNAELRLWLKEKAGRSVKINISTVAQEAGRSRGLIAKDDCAYPTVRQLILVEKEESGVAPRSRDDVIAKLRTEIAELRAQLASAEAHAAYHFAERIKAEKEAHQAARYRDLYKELQARVGEEKRQSTKGKVVPLYPENADHAE